MAFLPARSAKYNRPFGIVFLLFGASFIIAALYAFIREPHVPFGAVLFSLLLGLTMSVIAIRNIRDGSRVRSD